MASLVSSAYDNIITPKKSKRDKAAARSAKAKAKAKAKSNGGFSSREEKLVAELSTEQSRLIDLLNQIKVLGLLQIRVKDAPNSQWEAPFEGHEWDLKNEEYRVKGYDEQ